VLICGGPKCGKTTLSYEMKGSPTLHTDDLLDLDWSEQSRQIMRWLEKPGPWIIEGHAVVRGLRKWLREHDQGLPFDYLIYLNRSKVERTNGQEVLGKSVRTIWQEIAGELDKRKAALGKDAPCIEDRK
jgi:hypothetical protein